MISREEAIRRLEDAALDGGMLDAAKVGVLAASALSAMLGMALLIFSLGKR
ncbi:MAG: hypothetical protein IMF18_12070 [Proteobacteria bacterium]|nr:hypothetical protein [Pseudomonadota bacterium]